MTQITSEKEKAKLDRLRELQERIKRQLLLNFTFTQEVDIIFLFERL
jgi:hypothetical protein